MSLRPPASARLTFLGIGLVAALLAGLLSPTVADAARGGSTTASRASTSAYGPWSDYYYDVKVRVATPTKKRSRLYVQIWRKSGEPGDRQFRLTWHSSGRSAHTGGRKLAPQGRTTGLRTFPLPCGKTRVTLMGRSRAPGGSYGAWKSFSAHVNRVC
jgi:hypothetical protein